ncbi:MAG: NAD-dependent epimerase/dehydratase family protein [Bacteroidota bacterium]
MPYLITGSAGFIGFHTAKSLLDKGETVVGIDNLNDYYSPKLKLARNAILLQSKNYSFNELNICDHDKLKKLHDRYKFQKIIHLAAQAGIRYSLEAPFSYAESNLQGFLSILELARYGKIEQLIYASSSSVYGANAKLPFSVSDPVSTPISFYGATKIANEAMAYSYHHLFHIPMIGLRFFTVYGPWGRPDMAYYKFATAIHQEKPIDVYNEGKMNRSFTYITDVVDGILACTQLKREFEILNIGNNESVPLLSFIQCLEKNLGKKAKLQFLPAQPGDMQSTAADIAYTTKLLGYKPKISIEKGLSEFVSWFMEYFKASK